MLYIEGSMCLQYDVLYHSFIYLDSILGNTYDADFPYIK